MNKIYTKLGDYGLTNLSNGKKVKKSSEIIEFYGSLDELNVFLCHVAEYLCAKYLFINLLEQIYRIQKKIFIISSSIVSEKKIIINILEDIKQLEEEIDYMNNQLPILKSFILPSGGEIASRLHLARVVCRRAERVAFRLAAAEDKNDNAKIIGIYLNRLGDWLYVAARFTAILTNKEEIPV